MYRIETPEYPTIALREMLLNAMVHRSYMGSFTQLRVYDEKINLWNDGGLPEGINLEALKRSHKSKPRNLLIADVCFKGGLIDAWGRGTISIINACEEAGLPEPELIEEDGGFMVTLSKDRFTEEQLQQLGLNDRQIKAVLYMKEKGKITNAEYQQINSISERTASREISELVKADILEQAGTFGAGSFYKIKTP